MDFNIFNSLHVNDEFFYNLFFIGSLITAFFGCDFWLLTKFPDLLKKDIKLIDFFVSRLRLFIPYSVLVLLVAFWSSLLADKNGFIFTFGYIAGSFYFSGGIIRFFIKKEKELLEVILVYSVLVIPIFGLKLTGIGLILAVAGCIASFLVVFALIKKFFFKRNNN